MLNMYRHSLAIVTLLIAIAPAAAGPDPVTKCTAAKVKAAGMQFARKAQCHSRAILKSEIVSLECLQKAELKFEKAVAKADATGDCVGNAATITADIDMCVSGLVDEVTPAIGDSCIDASTCGGSPLVCLTSGFPDGYCTIEGCPIAGTLEGCSDDSVCADLPLGATNFCAARCDTVEIGTQGSCRSGYLCTDSDPGMSVVGGCVPA